MRTFSVEERQAGGGASVLAPAPRRSKPKRPHTADGELGSLVQVRGVARVD